jgi:hypothetical protein
VFIQYLTSAYVGLREYFPRYTVHPEPQHEDSLLTTPLHIFDENEAITGLISVFQEPELKKRRLFEDLRTQLERNDIEPEYSLKANFARTPFAVLSKVQIPIELPDETRFAGMWTIAPQGMGKTTLLHSVLAKDIEKDACIILMDSKGDLIEPFMHHPALARRRIIIGPDNPIGMNPLDIPHTDINKTVDNLEYIFASLLEFKLTATQSMLLKAVLRTLVTTFPKPSLSTFQEIMGEQPTRDIRSHVVFTKYAAYIKQLEPDLQQFFQSDFFTDNMKSRWQEVLQRLRLLLDNDLLRTMLMASSTTFRIGEAMDQGAFVIINNSRGKLGIKGAEFFGRFFIAQVLAAAQQRSFRKDSEKKPVYFYLDEAHTVIANDERITDILHECRSQKIALILAHQETTQVSAAVLSALQNCAIRFAHPDEEVRKLAPSLRMDVQTLQTLKRGQFGAYIRGFSQNGIVVNVAKADLSVGKPTQHAIAGPALQSVPPGTLGTFDRDQTPRGMPPQEPKTELDSLPRMTDDERAPIRERMQSDISSSSPQSKSEQVVEQSAPQADPDAPVRPTPEHDPGEPSDDWGEEEK